MNRELTKERQKKRREDYFSGKKCFLCGVRATQLHHVIPQIKKLSNLWGLNDSKREIELAKCITLCKTCHIDTHKTLRFKHGYTRYKRYGCRCSICVSAYRTYHQNYYARKVCP